MMNEDRLQSQKLRSCVLILGMHRSGTSALAGVLSMLGCDLPATPMPASKRNAKGFFESLAVRDFNDELLASAGSSWDDFTRFHDDWLDSPRAGGFIERAQELLQQEFGQSELFILKDPRICRFVPFWIRAIELSGCTVKPVLTTRNPIEVAHSLQSKKEYSAPLSEMIWLRYALDAERSTRGMPRFHTSFEQLMEDWEAVVQNSQEALQLIWPKSVASAEFEIGRFLSGDLRHHKEAGARATTSSLLPGWLRETYEVLNGWAREGEKVEDYATLDRIRAEFDVASGAFGRLVRAERDAAAEQKESIEAIEHVKKAARAELEQKTVELEQELAGRDQELVTLKQSLDGERASRGAERAALEQAQAAEAAQREEAERQLAAARAEADENIGAVKKLLQEQRRRNTLMEAELHQLRETLQDELAQTRSELAASQARRKEASRLIARRDAEIQARYDELAILERMIVESSLSGRLRSLVRRVKRLARGPSSMAPAANDELPAAAGE